MNFNTPKEFHTINLSINLESHSFSVQVAKDVGINCAILFNHFYFWIKINASKNENFKNGKYWTYQTYEQMQHYIDYLSLKQIRLALEKLIEHGYIVKDFLDDDKFKRTAWYGIGDKYLKNDVTKNTNDDDDEKGKCICPGGQIECNSEGKCICPPGQIDSYQRDKSIVTKGTNASYSKDTKETTTTGEKDHKKSVVVVFPDSFEFLKDRGFDFETAAKLSKHPIEFIKEKVLHLEQEQQVKEIPNPIGWLRMAIEYDWKNTRTSKEIKKVDDQSSYDEKKKLIRNACEDFRRKISDFFTKDIYFVVAENGCVVYSEAGSSAIDYNESTLTILTHWIRKTLNITLGI